MTFITACSTTSNTRTVNDAAIQAAAQKIAAQIIAKEREANVEMIRIPKQPARCNTRVLSGVSPADPPEYALQKTDIALYEANKRILSCYKNNELIRLSREPKAPAKAKK